ncbi:MAG: hypothetical protein AAGA95_16295 [Pseudomonadota bacterium]
MTIAKGLEHVLLSSSVRFGTQPDSPELLERYLESCGAAASHMSVPQQREYWESVFELLMETYCDTAVAAHWRCLCLDNVHRALGELSLLAQIDGEDETLRRCLRLLRSYTDYLPTAYSTSNPTSMR